MCSGGGSPAPVQTAPAPAAPEPAPVETSLTEARRKQGEDLYGTSDGSAQTRYRDDSTSGTNVGKTSGKLASGRQVSGNSGLKM